MPSPLLRSSVALLLAVLLTAAPARAQTYWLRSFGPAEGLGHVRSLALDTTSAGRSLWLATPRGLVRYDGARFTLDAAAPAPAHGVASGPDGTRWLWASDGLYHSHPGAPFQPLAVPAPIQAVVATAIPGSVGLGATADGRLAVWADGAGLWLFDPARVRWTRLLAPRPGEDVRDFVETAEGEGWVTTQRRLGRLTLPSGGRPGRVAWVATISGARFVRPHPEGAWVTTGRGLYLYRQPAPAQAGGTVQEVRLSDGVHRCWFTTPDVAPDGTLALTVEADRLALYLVGPDGAVRHRVGTENGLRIAVLDAVRFDGEGGLWLASEHGLDYLEDPGRLAAFALPTTAGVTELRVHPRDGALWVGTYGGLFRHTSGRFAAIGPASRGAGELAFMPNGAAYWVGWGGEPYRVAGFRWAGGRTESAPLSGLPRAVLPDGRTLALRPGRAGGSPSALVLSSGEVLDEGAGSAAVAEGPPPRRRAWLLLDGRLDALEGSALASASPTAPSSLRAAVERFDGLAATSLAADRHGRIWVATPRGPFALYETGPDVWAVRQFGLADGLLTEIVQSLHLTGGERLWLATADGVQGFALHAAEPWLRPIPLPGLNAALPTRAMLDVAEDGDGVLWIAPQGAPPLYRYDARAAAALPPPAVRLSALAVNDRPLRLPSGPLHLRADTSRLAFALAPGTFRRTADLRYEYRLAGLDTAWVALEGDPTVRFAYLAPGRYLFEARAAREGEAPGPVLRQALVLTPPFWRAPWFYALLALGLVAAVGGGVWRRARQTAARQRVLEATVAERTAALRAEKATTEAQAARLAELDEAKSRFFANVSHELRTPLTLLLGPLRDAQAGRFGALPEGLARHLPLMERSGARLHRLIGQLLDLARLDAGRLRLHREATDLVALAGRAVLSFASEAERQGLALSFESGPTALPAVVDAERVEEVLTNLVGNALKFTPAGGRIRVAVREAEAGWAEVTVADTGEGIAPEVLPHVFERFRQGDDSATRAHGGAGIGLALVHELVTLHGGTVAVESAVGEGTTFTVRLPVGERMEESVPLPLDRGRSGGGGPGAPRPSNSTSPGPPPVQEGEGLSLSLSPSHPLPPSPVPTATVLLVEDHADLRAYVAGLLAGRYRVEEAPDGQAGLEAARRLAASGRPPDLVLSDVMMPRLDGVALCRTLKADDALGAVPVVLLTARADEETRLEGLGTGADDYLTKPFNADELLLRCENLIEGRRRLRARFSGEVVVRPAEVVVPSEEAAWLAEVQAVVEKHLADTNLSVEWLAEELATSPRSLQRRLKEASGLSPAAFVRLLRPERAAQMLVQGTGPVAEVARAVGFRDPDYFARAFRQGFGVAPSVFAGRASAAGHDGAPPGDGAVEGDSTAG